ncbi:MAG: alpha-ketoglutarate-dependent dioxygenase AlkB [Leptospira sp.]|nr:alpha-ketoglutarate-dependent dioxygenase AlkB [Leptospira sp.]
MDSNFSLFPSENLLPFDGIANYLGVVMSQEILTQYLKIMTDSLPWQQDEVVIYGKKILTQRKVVWFSDHQKPYGYSRTSKLPTFWTKEVIALKEIVEKHSGVSFNSCLANYYHSGEEGMSWHSDDESSLVPQGCIASLSLGAERRFDFKHKKNRTKISINLEPGSLLLMSGEIQTHWLHALPKTKKVKSPRINLTFRNMV